MSKLHSYPWYPDDWRGSETRHAMTAEERGIYRDLLDHCWAEGSLSSNPRVLASLACVTAEEWERSSVFPVAQFDLRDGRLYHRRVDERRPDLVDWHEDRRESGRQGGLKKAENRSKTLAQLEKNSSSALAELYLTPSKPLANVYPSASASSSLQEPNTNPSGGETALEHPSGPEPENPPPPPPGGKPKPQSQNPPPGHLRRLNIAEMPQPGAAKGQNRARAPTASASLDPAMRVGMIRVLSSAVAGRLGDPALDEKLLELVGGELERSGRGVEDLAELLRKKRQTIRNADSWGLVITIVQAACRSQPMRPRLSEYGRVLQSEDMGWDSGIEMSN